MTDRAVRPEKVVEVHARLMAARDLLREATHILDAAGVLDDDGLLKWATLSADLNLASVKIEAASKLVTKLLTCPAAGGITNEWSRPHGG